MLSALIMAIPSGECPVTTRRTPDGKSFAIYEAAEVRKKYNERIQTVPVKVRPTSGYMAFPDCIDAVICPMPQAAGRSLS